MFRIHYHCFNNYDLPIVIINWLIMPGISNYSLMYKNVYMKHSKRTTKRKISSTMVYSIRLIKQMSTHWGRVTHICVGNLTTIGLDNGLSPVRRHAIIWTNTGILLNGTSLGAHISEILVEIQTFSFRKMRWNVSSAKWQLFCLGLNVLRTLRDTLMHRLEQKGTIRKTKYAHFRSEYCILRYGITVIW